LKLEEELAKKTGYLAELEGEVLKLRAQGELERASASEILARLEVLENRINDG